MQRAWLSRSVEGEHREAAFCGGRCPEEVHLLSAAVESVVRDEGGRRDARRAAAVHIAGKRRPLKGDLDRLDRRLEQRRSLPEALNLTVISAADAWVIRLAVQEELGVAVVVGRAQVAVPCTDVVPAGQRRFGLCGYALRGGEPLVVPAVVIARLDLLDGHRDLAEVGTAVGAVTEAAERLKPELLIVGEVHGPHDETPFIFRLEAKDPRDARRRRKGGRQYAAADFARLSLPASDAPAITNAGLGSRLATHLLLAKSATRDFTT